MHARAIFLIVNLYQILMVKQNMKVFSFKMLLICSTFYSIAFGYLPILNDDFQSYQISPPSLEDQSEFENLEAGYTCEVQNDSRIQGNKIVKLYGGGDHWRFLKTKEDGLGNMIGDVSVKLDFSVSVGYLNFYIWEVYGSSTSRPLHVYLHSNGNIGLFLDGGWRHYYGAITANNWYRIEAIIHFKTNGTSTLEFKIIRLSDGAITASDNGIDCMGTCYEARTMQLSLAPTYLAYVDNLFVGPTCQSLQQQNIDDSSDLNGDCKIDFLDLKTLAINWLEN